MYLPLFIVDTCQVAMHNSMVRTEVEGSQVCCHCPVRPHTVTDRCRYSQTHRINSQWMLSVSVLYTHHTHCQTPQRNADILYRETSEAVNILDPKSLFLKPRIPLIQVVPKRSSATFWIINKSSRHTTNRVKRIQWHMQTRSSATAKSTSRPSCLVGVLYDISRWPTTDQQLINHLYESGHETYRIPRNNAK